MANKNLKATITIGGAISGTLSSAIGSTKSKISEIGSAISDVKRRQAELNQVIREQEKLGQAGSALRVQYAQQELAQLDKQITKLRTVNEQLRKNDAAVQANLARRSELRGQMVDAVALGATAGTPIVAAAKFETAMLGVSKQLDGARDSAGKLTPKYYEMATAIQQMGRELPIPTNKIAEMTAAGLRMGVAGDQVLEFVRRSAEMATAFEMPESELAESMGKIAGLYKIPIPAIGSLADTINYLDDNAISKGGDIIDFLTRVGGVASSVKITGNEMSALGSTLLTLGERTENAGTATNAMFQKLAAAEKGSKKFISAMREIGLSPTKIQKGMQVDAMGTMLKVLDAIGKLDDDKRLGVMVELVGLEHSDTMAKLAGNTEELRKQLALANSEAAKGSMSREFQARMQTTNAQWDLMKNRVSELAVNIGSVLLPALNNTMSVIGPVVSSVAEWARENPRLTQAIVGTATALVTLRLGSLVAGYAFTFLRGGLLNTVGLFYRVIPAAIAAGSATGAAAAGPTLLGRAFMFAGKGVLWLGRTLLMNPIGLAVTAIGAAAFLIYQYWEPIRGFFTGLWADITNTARTAFDWILGKIAIIGDGWRAVKGFFGFGDSEAKSVSKNQSPATTLPGTETLPDLQLATARGGSQNITNTQNNTITINQQPGQDGKALASEVLREMERINAVRGRSNMFDPVMP